MASPNERILFAAKSNSVDVLREIIENNPPEDYDVNFVDGLGMSALHYAVQFSPDCLEFLLETEGTEMDGQNRTEKSTPLHLAAQLENDDVKAGVIELLVDAGADPRIKDKHGAIPAEYLTKVDDEAGVDKRLIRLLAIATAELNIETGNADIASDEDYNEGDEASDYEDSE